MSGSILKLDKLKVYYPFLRDNRGMEHALVDELPSLISYLLVADVVVIPPRELIGGKYGAQNIELINKSILLSHLISTGKIVTTSSSTLVRDSKDLIEYYSAGRISKDTNINIYERDSIIQKESYITHMASHISGAKYYSEAVKQELDEFLRELPDHPSVMRKIDSLQDELDHGELERLRLEAFHGYFNGGAIGNAAIMPTMHVNDGKVSIYNPFYSKEAVANFSIKLQSSLKGELSNISPDLIDKVFESLAIFRIRYSNISSSYEAYYTKIVELLEKNSLSIKLPTDILYVTVALSIASLLSEVLTKEVMFGSVLSAYSAKYIWGYINRTMKVTDYFSTKLQSYLEFTGLYNEFRKDVAILTEEFESSVEKAVCH